MMQKDSYPSQEGQEADGVSDQTFAADTHFAEGRMRQNKLTVVTYFRDGVIREKEIKWKL